MLDERLIGIEAFIIAAQLTQPWTLVSGVSRTQVRVVSSAWAPVGRTSPRRRPPEAGIRVSFLCAHSAGPLFETSERPASCQRETIVTPVSNRSRTSVKSVRCQRTPGGEWLSRHGPCPRAGRRRHWQ